MKQAAKLLSSLKSFWQVYGGFEQLRGSPYLWIAFALNLLVSHYASDKWIWYEKAVSILPNIIGFSLGGYAVMLAFGDSRFLDVIRGASGEGKSSPYMQASASLANFVLVQTIVLILSVVFDAMLIQNKILNFIGSWLFFYALLLAIAATLSIFFLSRMYDKLPPPDK